MAETRQLRVVIAGDAKTARSAIRGLASELNTLDAQTQRTNDSWEAFSDRIVGIGALAAGGLAIAAGAVAYLGITTAAKFEQLEVSFSTLLKSNAKAKEEMAWLKEKAAATPFELGDLAAADRTLLGFGFKLDEFRRNFLMTMGETAAAVGLPSSRLPDLARIFGQVHAAGVVSMEDINQLIDNGVPIWDMLTAATKKSVKVLREEIENRKLSADTFESAVQVYTKNNFAGAMQAQSQTLSGLWSTLKDNVSMAAMSMVEPLIPLVKEWMPKFAEGAQKAGEWINNTLVPAIRDDFIPAVKTTVEWVGKVVNFIDKTTVGLGPLGAMLKGAAAAILVLVVAMKIWAAIQAVLNFLMAANPIGIVIVAIAALAAGIAYLWQNNETFRKVVIAVWGVVKTVVTAVVSFIVAYFKFMFNLLVTFWTGVWNGVVAYFKFMLNLLVTIWTGVWNGIVAYFSFMFNLWLTIVTTVWNTAKNLTVAAWNGIKNAISTAVNAITGVVRSIYDRVVGFFQGIGTWLYDSGKRLIQGLIDGIKSMADRLYQSVKGPLDKVRNLLPFSPAKEGPFSGKGWTLYSGRSMVEGLAQGIGERRGVLTKAALGTAELAHTALSGGLAAHSLGSPATGGNVNVTVNVAGSVATERDLAKTIAITVRDEIVRSGKRNGGRTGL